MVTRRTFLKMVGALCAPIPSWARQPSVPVLMYHDINYDSDDQYSVTPEQFKEHMVWLKRNGYRAISLHDIDNAKTKDIIITFDDGYFSFLEHAYPVLYDCGFHSIVNVVGKWMSSTVTHIPDTKPRRALDWGTLKILSKTKIVDIGCHTYNLHNLNNGVLNATREELQYDFSTFQANMTVHIGKPTDIIAWPFGRYNDLAITEAEKQGFKYFLTSHSGRYDGNMYRIPRISVEKNTKVFDNL